MSRLPLVLVAPLLWLSACGLGSSESDTAAPDAPAAAPPAPDATEAAAAALDALGATTPASAAAIPDERLLAEHILVRAGGWATGIRVDLDGSVQRGEGPIDRMAWSAAGRLDTNTLRDVTGLADLDNVGSLQRYRGGDPNKQDLRAPRDIWRVRHRGALVKTVAFGFPLPVVTQLDGIERAVRAATGKVTPTSGWEVPGKGWVGLPCRGGQILAVRPLVEALDNPDLPAIATADLASPRLVLHTVDPGQGSAVALYGAEHVARIARDGTVTGHRLDSIGREAVAAVLDGLDLKSLPDACPVPAERAER